jgi:ABC-type polysaccharide/polyol phosphate transport system ATPase subunit
VRFDGVGKVYRWRDRRPRRDTVKGWLLQRRQGSALQLSAGHTALEDVDLDIRAGEAVALVGPNGSGKSTLLKLAGGILRPTSGTVEVEGRVTALIELGAGFHPEITGRENVLINGMLLGLTRRDVEERMDDILAFAGLGEFIDRPVKTYSSGMYVRLGFAVAVAADPDVLLIDEVLAVGDEAFNRRCLDRLAHLRRSGVTMVLVSHDLDLVEVFADRAVYLREGRVVIDGPPDVVVARYRSDVAGESAPAGTGSGSAVRVVEEGRRWGTGAVEIVDVSVSSGDTVTRVVPSGADCVIELGYRVQEPVEDAVFGLAWHREDGAHVGGHNTAIDGVGPTSVTGDGSVRCRYPVLDLAPGEYLLDVAVHAINGLAYDYWCQAARLRVEAAVGWPGVWAPPHRWEGDGPEWE